MYSNRWRRIARHLIWLPPIVLLCVSGTFPILPSGDRRNGTWQDPRELTADVINGHAIKWIAVVFLSIFDAIWRFIIWLTFRAGGLHTEDGEWIDREKTPFRFWSGIGLVMALVLGAVAFTVLLATR